MAMIACPDCKSGSEAPDQLIGTKAICFSCGASGLVCPENEVEETLQRLETLTRQSPVGLATRSSPEVKPSNPLVPKQHDSLSWLTFGSQAAIVILLFATLLSQLTVFTKVTQSKTEWEYKIAQPLDSLIESDLSDLGEEGWELVTARRAVGKYTGANYECILKRRVLPK